MILMIIFVLVALSWIFLFVFSLEYIMREQKPLLSVFLLLLAGLLFYVLCYMTGKG